MISKEDAVKLQELHYHESRSSWSNVLLPGVLIAAEVLFYIKYLITGEYTLNWFTHLWAGLGLVLAAYYLYDRKRHIVEAKRLRKELYG